MQDNASFDPYRKWLGIARHEQPPHHYRLLGIALFESDADVIAHAADARMNHLRTLQKEPHVEAAQRLLNEVATARVCLLNMAEKVEYDSQLRAHLESRPSIELVPTIAPPPPPPGAGGPTSGLPSSTTGSVPPWRREASSPGEMRVPSAPAPATTPTPTDAPRPPTPTMPTSLDYRQPSFTVPPTAGPPNPPGMPLPPGPTTVGPPPPLPPGAQPAENPQVEAAPLAEFVETRRQPWWACSLAALAFVLAMALMAGVLWYLITQESLMTVPEHSFPDPLLPEVRD